MKKINTTGLIITAVIALVTLTFSSCDLLGGVKLDKAEDAEKLKDAIVKNIKPGTKVREVSIFPLSQELTSEVGMISVYYLTENDEKRAAHIYLNPSMDTVDEEEKTFNKKKEEGRVLDEYDFSQIFSNVNKAVQLVTDNGQKYSGIGSYKITFSSNPEKDEHRFSVRSKAGSGIQGRSVVTEYYEFDAKADAQGNVTVELPESEE